MTAAGGSAKQGRNRATQAILPLKGKILNVASASRDKIAANQEIQDIAQALGVGLGARFDVEDLRYDKVIIMTDADVDGAHIAALLITFFHQEMPELIQTGRLYLAQPPLFRLSAGGKTIYAMDEESRDALLENRVQIKPESRCRPLQGPRRNDAGAVERDHHEPGNPVPRPRRHRRGQG